MGQSSELTMTRVLGKTGFLNTGAYLILVDGGTYDLTTVAIIRSKKDANSGAHYYSAGTSLAITAPINALAEFQIFGEPGTPLALNVPGSGLTVSMDETKKNYIVKALGTNPENVDGDYGLFVDLITPHWVRQQYTGSSITTFKSGFTNAWDYIAYEDTYRNSKTPMIVSKVIGASTRDMFYFETISDGNASSREIKVSIASIDDINRTFDVVVRKFEDTDANTLQSGRLELFRGLTMDDTQPNFIGKAIGTTDGTYPRVSSYVTVTFADNFPRNTVPAGFKGYSVRYSASTFNAPEIMYKTKYDATDTVSKAYLGLSELAYSSFTQSLVGVKNSIKSLEADLFKYQGAVTTGKTTLKGFHMESGATSALYVTGEKGSIGDYSKAQAKFTVAPAGGFDGWNQFKKVTFTDDGADVDNLQSFKDAIDLMAIPETVDVNLFATPDVNFLDNLGAVNYALSMVEGRADALYIIDAPRYASDSSQDTSAIATDLQGSGLDSNYAQHTGHGFRYSTQSTRDSYSPLRPHRL